MLWDGSGQSPPISANHLGSNKNSYQNRSQIGGPPKLWPFLFFGFFCTPRNLEMRAVRTGSRCEFGHAGAQRCRRSPLAVPQPCWTCSPKLLGLHERTQCVFAYGFSKWAGFPLAFQFDPFLASDALKQPAKNFRVPCLERFSESFSSWQEGGEGGQM